MGYTDDRECEVRPRLEIVLAPDYGELVTRDCIVPAIKSFTTELAACSINRCRW